MSEKILQNDTGIPKSILQQITATENDVVSGKSFLASDGTIKNGAIIDRGKSQYNGSFGAGDQNGRHYISLSQIPEGVYRKNDTEWAPEIRTYEDELMNWFGYTKGGSLSGYNNQNQNGGTVELRRDEGNHLAYGHTVANVACTISGRAAHITGQAYFHVDNNGTSGIIGTGNHSVINIDFWVSF